jgi:hypothetical protein
MGLELIPITIINTFFNGASMMASLVAAIFFTKFWRTSGDRFFSIFALAFYILGLERIALMLSHGLAEADPSVYLFRCLGFSLLIFAVVEKNRQRNRN